MSFLELRKDNKSKFYNERASYELAKSEHYEQPLF